MEPSLATVDGPQELHGRKLALVFAGLMLVMLMAALDATIVATALPTIAGDLGGLNHISWVTTAYLLAQTVVTPLYGKLGDQFGRRIVLQVGLVIFLVGSALCGLSHTFPELIASGPSRGWAAAGSRSVPRPPSATWFRRASVVGTKACSGPSSGWPPWSGLSSVAP